MQTIKSHQSSLAVSGDLCRHFISNSMLNIVMATIEFYPHVSRTIYSSMYNSTVMDDRVVLGQSNADEVLCLVCVLFVWIMRHERGTRSMEAIF